MYSEEARDDAVMGRTIGVSWHNAQCELPFMTYSCHHFDLRAAAQWPTARTTSPATLPRYIGAPDPRYLRPIHPAPGTMETTYSMSLIPPPPRRRLLWQHIGEHGSVILAVVIVSFCICVGIDLLTYSDARSIRLPTELTLWRNIIVGGLALPIVVISIKAFLFIVIKAAVHPNPRIAVNATHRGWKAYQIWMYLCGLFLALLNGIAWAVYFYKFSGYEYRRRSLGRKLYYYFLNVTVLGSVALFTCLAPCILPEGVLLPILQKVWSCCQSPSL